MATDGQIVMAAARWADEAVYLKDFANKRSFPTVVKFVKGQYGGFGVPSLPNPGLQSTALLFSAGKRHKILGQGVKIKEGRRVIGVGPRIEIPESYPGYFELLSEEGRGMRAIESVLELSRRMPDTGFLVRESIRGIIAKNDGDGNLITNGQRTIVIGETLLPLTETQLSGHKNKFLQCVDSNCEFVLLGLDQRGKFSILAKEDHISGVHTAKNLLSKRLPLTVRLVHGPPPKGLKSSTHQISELRLHALVQEENLFALPLQKDLNTVVPIPLAATLKLQPAKNLEFLKGLKEFQRLTERGAVMVKEVSNRAHVIDGKVSESKIKTTNSNSPVAKTSYFLRRSSSLDSPSHIVKYPNENKEPSVPDDYDDIDQIYDYVRGFAPLPKNIRSPFAEPKSETDKKPEPPPIETIPTKKLLPLTNKAEKRTRKEIAQNPVRTEKGNQPSMYVKNSNVQRNRILRQKATSPLKEYIQNPSKNGSPIFGLRYKSLTNLHQAMEMDGTLDSSHSGGRTSGDSGAGPKLPEKRSRRLSRPLSLTNLVWEICRPQEFHSTSARKSTSPLKATVDHEHPARIGTLYF